MVNSDLQFDKIVTFDVESTGVSVEQDRIVTAFVGLVSKEGELLESHEWLINPGITIPAEATAIHGVTTERAERDGDNPGIAILEIVEQIARYDSLGIPIVAYNAAFDFSILRYEAERYNVKFTLPLLIIDPFVIWKHIDKYRKGKRTLVAAAERFGVPLIDAHNAAADAIAAGMVAFEVLKDKRFENVEVNASDLMRLQTAWAQEQAESLQEYFRKTDPSATVDGSWPLRSGE